MGDMLWQRWERYAIDIANTDDVIASINLIIKEECIDVNQPANVVFARDTRPSGEPLAASLIDGVKAFNGKIIDYNLMTTPQLHYVTRCLNTQGILETYGVPTAEGYYDKLASAFKKMVSGYQNSSKIKVDCANGVGALALKSLMEQLKDEINIDLVNTDVLSRGKLNHQCGADFVKLYQRAPVGMELLLGEKSCSLDGDADRIVFYYKDKGKCIFILCY